MQFAWLYSVGCRSRRFSHPLSRPPGAQAQQSRWSYWFERDVVATAEQILEGLGIEEDVGSNKCNHAMEAVAEEPHRIHALLLLEPVMLHESCDVLTLLSEEQAILRRYFDTIVLKEQEDHRLQFLRVVQIIGLATPVVPLSAESFGRVRSQFFRLPRVTVRRIMESPTVGRGPTIGEGGLAAAAAAAAAAAEKA